MIRFLICALAGFLLASTHKAIAQPTFMDMIERIKPSIVGVGTQLKTRSPAVQFFGTGFVVADGRYVITNAHNVDRPLDTERRETPIVLVAGRGEPTPRDAQIIAVDREHDVALMRLSGDPIPALRLGDPSKVREGQMLAFTGFPLALVLGFNPVTHRAMVSAITPVAVPGITSRQLNAQQISRIREAPYRVFQLDATAYPGNSGSPLYEPDTGAVVGIVNSVFVQGSRENAIGRPSGISYAIPAQFIRDMLARENVRVTD